MNRELLLALLGQTYLEPFAFDDDDDDDTPDDNDDDSDDESSDDSDEKETGKKDAKKSDDKGEKKKSAGSPDSLKKQVSDLQKKLAVKNKRIADLSKENRNRRLKDKGEKPKSEDGGEGDDDSEVSTLRQTVQELTNRLDDLSSENFIEKNVIRKLQPLVAAGLDDDVASRKLNAAMKLVDPDEDFDDEGNFDSEGFIERHPYLAVEAKEETGRDRLIGGSGKKGKSKKDYVGDAIKRFNQNRTGKVDK